MPSLAAPPPSATLATNERVQARIAAGAPVLHLGFGEAGLPVLPGAAERLGAAAGANGYGPVAGSPRAPIASSSPPAARRCSTRCSRCSRATSSCRAPRG
jgi:hypothetical protein